MASSSSTNDGGVSRYTSSTVTQACEACLVRSMTRGRNVVKSSSLDIEDALARTLQQARQHSSTA